MKVIIGTDIVIMGEIALSISLGMLLSVVNFYCIACWIHEKSHKSVTLRFTNLDCYIKRTKGKFGFHTECEYYKHLESNRNNLDIQYIISKIAIAGYIGEFSWLIGTCILALVIDIWVKCYGLNVFCICTLGFIGLNIKQFIVSSDLKYYLQPWLFVYKYK